MIYHWSNGSYIIWGICVGWRKKKHIYGVVVESSYPSVMDVGDWKKVPLYHMEEFDKPQFYVI